MREALVEQTGSSSLRGGGTLAPVSEGCARTQAPAADLQGALWAE